MPISNLIETQLYFPTLKPQFMPAQGIISALFLATKLYLAKLEIKNIQQTELESIKANILARDDFYQSVIQRLGNEISSEQLTAPQVYGRLKAIKDYLYKYNIGGIEAGIKVLMSRKKINPFGIAQSSETIENIGDLNKKYIIDAARDVYAISHNVTDIHGNIIGTITLQQPLRKLGYNILRTTGQYNLIKQHEIFVASNERPLSSQQYEKLSLGDKEISFYTAYSPQKFHHLSIDTLLLMLSYAIISSFIINGIGKNFYRRYSNFKQEHHQKLKTLEGSHGLSLEKIQMMRRKINFINALFAELDKRINYFTKEDKRNASPARLYGFSELKIKQLEGIVSYFHDEIETKDIIIKYSIEKPVSNLLCDILLAQRILLWQLSKIVRVIQKRGIIEINIRKHTDEMQIFITDDRFHCVEGPVQSESKPTASELKNMADDLNEIEDIEGFDIKESKHGMQGNEVVITLKCIVKASKRGNVIDIKTLLKNKTHD